MLRPSFKESMPNRLMLVERWPISMSAEAVADRVRKQDEDAAAVGTAESIGGQPYPPE